MVLSTKRILLLGIFAALAAIIASVGGAYVLARSSAKPSQGGSPDSAEQSAEKEGTEHETQVVAAHLRRDPKLVLSVRQLLSVEPYRQADLRSQVAGVVHFVPKSINDPVKRGEVLIAVDVPELDQDLREKEAMVNESLQAVTVARATADNARATAEVYREVINLRKAERGQAEATRDYRLSIYNRFVKLGKGEALQDGVIEEEFRNYRAADFALKAADVAIHRAEADLREKESLIGTAEADIKFKEAQVEMARKNRDKAAALLNFSQIQAPFDGVVIKRQVDLGTFVQNASSGQSDPLLTVARSDIVTLVMKVPDNAAPYVSVNTEAVIDIDELPGVVIRGKVTRFSPCILNHDRTMRVEVDLYNRSPKGYGDFVARQVAGRLTGIAANSPLGLAGLLAGSQEVWNRELKSYNDPLPTLPIVSGSRLPSNLIPGMSGYMRLNLQSFKDAYLIPSCAVFTEGGRAYVLEVKDGVTQMLPVHVQFNDGKLAKVSVVLQYEDPAVDRPEVLRELTADDIIILSRQSEIGEGKSVKVTMQKW